LAYRSSDPARSGGAAELLIAQKRQRQMKNTLGQIKADGALAARNRWAFLFVATLINCRLGHLNSMFRGI